MITMMMMTDVMSMAMKPTMDRSCVATTLRFSIKGLGFERRVLGGGAK